MTEYQPITQRVDELPNIMSVPEMMVVEKKGDYYIAIGGEWKKIVSEKRYIYAEGVGTQPTGSAIVELTKTDSTNHFAVVDGKIRVKANMTAKISLSLNIGFAGAFSTTGNSVPARIYFLRNDDSLKDFKITLQDNDDENSEVGSVVFVDDLTDGDEISVMIENSDPDGTRTISYVIDLIIEEL